MPGIQGGQVMIDKLQNCLICFQGRILMVLLLLLNRSLGNNFACFWNISFSILSARGGDFFYTISIFENLGSSQNRFFLDTLFLVRELV